MSRGVLLDETLPPSHHPLCCSFAFFRLSHTVQTAARAAVVELEALRVKAAALEKENAELKVTGRADQYRIQILVSSLKQLRA